MKNELILLSGADIPFVEGTITIHQPKVYEISMIGEEVLFIGCELLKFTKDILNIEDKSKLNNQSDFNILMSIIMDKSESMMFNISCAKQVLELIFPYYKIIYTPVAILFMDINNENVLCGQINENNFNIFKDIIIQMFCLQKVSTEQTEYNAKSELAKQIAEKLKNRQKQLAELQKSAKKAKIAIFSRYISILTVGQQKDINSFMQYTVYQLFDEFQRFDLKRNFDNYFQARLAGAKDLEMPEDWMKDIHS